MVGSTVETNMKNMEPFPGLIDEGKGPILLFVHGFPDTPQVWRSVIDLLKDRYRCIAPTLPGFGLDDGNPSPDYTVEGKRTFIQNVLDHLNITEKVTPVVFDHGGPFGLHWAVHHPDRVARLIVMNTLVSPLYKWHIWAKLWRTPGVGEFAMRTLTWPMFWLSVRVGAWDIPRAPMREAYDALTPAFKKNALGLYRATDPELFIDVVPRLEALSKQCEIMVIWGEKDPYIEKEFAHRYFAKQVEMLPECGHWCMVQNPAKVAELISNFV